MAQTSSDRLIVIGCSVGGSCALEVAAIAPDRVAALVLIGTKANHRPEPQPLTDALELLESENIEAAWTALWAPLFSKNSRQYALQTGKLIALRQSVTDIMRGVSVFHTRPRRSDILANFLGPIHFITGADDIAPGPKRNFEQAALAKNGFVHLIERCGHYAPLEQSAQVNKILRQVISSCP